LRDDDFSFFARYTDINTLMLTAGFGRLDHFANVSEEHIVDSMQVNSMAIMRLVHRFYPRICSNEPFYTGVMGSIAGFMSSPLFAVYGASKAALTIFIESLNVELEMAGVENRILNVSPGNIKGTSFYAEATDMSVTRALGEEIIERLMCRDDLFIPNYDTVYREVLERYHRDFRAEGRHSYEYKMKSGRLKNL
jgi:short-subunit dehydrogenase